MVTTIFQSFKCKQICGKIVFYQSGWPGTKIKAMLHHICLKKENKKENEKIQNYGLQMAHTDLFTAYWKLNICIDLFLVKIQPGHNLYSSQTRFTLTKVNGSPRIFQLVTVNQMIVLCLYQYVKCDMLLAAVIKKWHKAKLWFWWCISTSARTTECYVSLYRKCLYNQTSLNLACGTGTFTVCIKGC